jgi:hypothetical protein
MGAIMKNQILCIMLTVLLGVLIHPVSANSQTILINDAIITGGGIITEGQGKDALKITFGVNVLIKYFADENGTFVDEYGNETINNELVFAEQPVGNIHINFHNTGYSNDTDKGKFTTTEITWMRINPQSYPDSEGEPNFIFVSLAADGKFNGEDGWTLQFRLSDFGNPGSSKATKNNLSDAVRITIIDPDGILVYDTAYMNLEFPREQGWRTLLDGGNLTVYYQR